MASKKVVEFHKWLRYRVRDSRRRERENYDWKIINASCCEGNAYLNAARELEDMFPELNPKKKTRATK